MDGQTFPKVYRRLSSLQNAKGELIVQGGALEHRSEKHGTLRMDPVREVTVAKEPLAQGGQGTFVRVAYGEGTAMGTALFQDLSNKLRPKATTEELASNLQRLLSLPAAATGEDMERLKAAEKERAGAMSAAVAKRGRKRMLIGGLMVVGGGIVTAVSYSVASSSSGGGRYFVFWGAIVFGAIFFLQGLVEYSKNRAALAAANAAQIPSGKGLDVETMKGNRDVDGLVEALWVDELDIRVKAMDALAELHDPRGTDRLIAALGSPRWDVRWSAAEALGKLGDSRAVEPLRSAVKDSNAMVRATAEQSLKALEGSAPPG